MIKLALALTLSLATALTVARPGGDHASAAGATTARPTSFKSRVIGWFKENTPGGMPTVPPSTTPSPGDTSPAIMATPTPDSARTPTAGWTPGVGSPRDRIFGSLLFRDCGQALRQTRAADGAALPEAQRGLYEGTAAACLAAFDGRPDLWPLAGRRLDQAQESGLDCPDSVVFQLLSEIVTAHREEPTAELVRERGYEVPCAPVWSRRG
ncbi:hypothetical protein [Actinoplanes sp. L3-i22]|uniref:hypothetical protein n=1 Tax=Actinoplanes sp. L3-i22 TaxID=2836373 RepID=UPI001C77482B|nr:hypothetical protein [Actinoplanes sp. L3-i22]BCY06818.1 hypothetical protein L3i22_019060 [Actinoplanes sp. L3-i22]